MTHSKEEKEHNMFRIESPIVMALFLSAAAASAQESTPAVKVYDVPKDGLKIDGKLTRTIGRRTF